MSTLPASNSPVGIGEHAHQFRAFRIPIRDESRYRHAVAHFGWVSDGTEERRGRRWVHIGAKRKLPIRDRDALARLEDDCRHSLVRIRALERSRRRGPALASWMLGLVGTSALAVSVFALLAGDFPSSVVAGVFGLVLWIATPAAHRLLARLQANRISGEILEEEETIGSIFRQASQMVGARSE